MPLAAPGLGSVCISIPSLGGSTRPNSFRHLRTGSEYAVHASLQHNSHIYLSPYNQQTFLFSFPILSTSPPLMPWLAALLGEFNLWAVRGLIGTTQCSWVDSLSLQPWLGPAHLAQMGTLQIVCRGGVAVPHQAEPGWLLALPRGSSPGHLAAGWGQLDFYALVSTCSKRVVPGGLGGHPVAWGVTRI